ncbi:hypothetical protein SDC9_143351 [bioreactor metagenome]|uniref:Uncharacterized protein n=1 Tax=bioreactor metagenome TaxID=1076179 RepID=A0A645E5V9_9ZZZZ
MLDRKRGIKLLESKTDLLFEKLNSGWLIQNMECTQEEPAYAIVNLN